MFAKLSAMSVVLVLCGSLPAAAQSRPAWDVYAGWSPFFGNNVHERMLPAWSVAVNGGGTRALSAALDVSGSYIVPGASIHNFLGGPRLTFPTGVDNRGFVQVVSGVALFNHYSNFLVIAPGGGVDVPLSDKRFSIRLQGDYFAERGRGDYGNHYWTHLWRVSTGLVVQPGR